MSNAAARRAPIFCCTRQAVDGKRHVRRDGGDDDQIDLLGGDAGPFHGAQRGLGGHVGGEFVRARRCGAP